MAGAFLYRDVVAGGIITAETPVPAAMPLSNLLDPQPRLRTRFGAGAGAARLVVDLLTTTAVDCVYLGSTTTGPDATVRVRLSTRDPTGIDGDVWDSGVLDADTSPACGGQIVVLAPDRRMVLVSQPLTGDATDIDGSSTTITGDMITRGNDYAEVSGSPMGRYLRVDLIDWGRVTVDIGLLRAGMLWRPAVGMLYGMREGRHILDRRDRNPFTGAEFAVPALGNPRQMTFTLPMLANAATAEAHRDLLDRLGGSGDALWIPETEDARVEINRRAIWGAVNLPGDDAMVERTNYSRIHRSFRMVERL